MALDLPDLYLDGVSEDDQKEGQLEEIETTEGGKEGEIRHGAEENDGIEDVAEEELEVQDAEADDDEDRLFTRRPIAISASASSPAIIGSTPTMTARPLTSWQ